MLKKIIDAFYDFVDYGPFSHLSFKSKEDSAYTPPTAPNIERKTDTPYIPPDVEYTPLLKHNFIKDHIIDIIGIVITVSLFFIEDLALFLGVWTILLCLLVLKYIPILLIILILIILAVNIAAYKLVKNNKATGIIPSLFGGVIGGYIAIQTSYQSYCEEKIIRNIFKVFIWICILVVTSVLLVLSGYYDF
ncbi:MAG: hypothetical protein MRZ61_01785 [Oscillospiraceae bacterium]|nr:hypothetical protein [Oscillospiraceae bacterium]